MLTMSTRVRVKIGVRIRVKVTFVRQASKYSDSLNLREGITTMTSWILDLVNYNSGG